MQGSVSSLVMQKERRRARPLQTRQAAKGPPAAAATAQPTCQQLQQQRVRLPAIDDVRCVHPL